MSNDESSEIITDEPYEGEPDEDLRPQHEVAVQDDEHDPEWDSLGDTTDQETGPVAPAGEDEA